MKWKKRQKTVKREALNDSRDKSERKQRSRLALKMHQDSQIENIGKQRERRKREKKERKTEKEREEREIRKRERRKREKKEREEREREKKEPSQRRRPTEIDSAKVAYFEVTSSDFWR